MRGLHLLARTSAAATLLVVAVAGAAPPVPQIAGVAADMTLDAARAAAPTVHWQNHVSPHTGKPTAVWADAAFTLAGQRYRVTLNPRPSGNAYLKLRSEEQVDKAKTCRARVVALAAHFDTYFDKIEPALSPLDKPRQGSVSLSYNRLPEGGGYVSATPTIVDDSRDYDTLEAGRNAKIQEIEYDDTGGVEWMTGQRAKDDFPYALDLLAMFYQGEDAQPSVCRIDATVTRYPLDRQWPGRPSFEELDTTKIKFTQKPSMALLHDSLDGIDLPPEGVSLAYRCDVNRTDGRLVYCNPHERKLADAKLERAARMRYAAMGFDPKGFDPDNDLPLKTNITVKLLPGERLKAEDLAKSKPSAAASSNKAPPAKPIAAPVWTQMPTSADLSRHYPPQALRNELQARVVATCRIAEDLSLACVSFDINPPENTMFEPAARRILALYRAAPKLKDGKDAAGAVVRVPIRFQLEDAPPPPAP